MTSLLENHRVSFLNGPVTMPFAKVPTARVDLILVPWERVAQHIVNDLITQDAFRTPGQTIFDAEAKFWVPLNQFAQEI
jgi:hypothetical protein